MKAGYAGDLMGGEGGSLDGTPLYVDPVEVELDQLLLYPRQARVDVNDHFAVCLLRVVHGEKEDPGAMVRLE